MKVISYANTETFKVIKQYKPLMFNDIKAFIFGKLNASLC